MSNRIQNLTSKRILVYHLCSRVVIAGMVLLTLSACEGEPELSVIPRIEFVSFSKDTLDQGPMIGDTVFVSIDFEDGNGDLGSDDGANIFFIDTRQDFIFSPFRMPELPSEGGNRAVQGTVTIRLLTTCCINEQGVTCPTDDPTEIQPVQFEVYIVDNAGNESNRILTPSLQIRCN